MTDAADSVRKAVISARVADRLPGNVFNYITSGGERNAIISSLSPAATFRRHAKYTVPRAIVITVWRVRPCTPPRSLWPGVNVLNGYVQTRYYASRFTNSQCPLNLTWPPPPSLRKDARPVDISNRNPKTERVQCTIQFGERQRRI